MRTERERSANGERTESERRANGERTERDWSAIGEQLEINMSQILSLSKSFHQSFVTGGGVAPGPRLAWSDYEPPPVCFVLISQGLVLIDQSPLINPVWNICFLSEQFFMFTGGEHKFADDELMFADGEHKFVGVEHKKSLRKKSLFLLNCRRSTYAVPMFRVSCFFVTGGGVAPEPKACLARLRTSTSLLCLDQRTVP